MDPTELAHHIHPFASCVVLQGKRCPEEVIFVPESGGDTTHFIPEIEALSKKKFNERRFVQWHEVDTSDDVSLAKAYSAWKQEHDGVPKFMYSDDGIVGHCMCGNCRQNVDLSDRFCKHCGAAFEVVLIGD